MLVFLRDLLAHSEWANANFMQSWGTSPAQEHEELRQRVQHVLIVQNAFLLRFQGEPFRMPPDGPLPSYAELKQQLQTSHNQLRKYADLLTEAEGMQTIHIPWFGDPPCHIQVTEALIQVVLHTQHHRGQLMTRLKDFGGTPQNVDWIIWLWKQKPVAEWN